jgi:histidyl-tRNA synthetase
MAEKLQPVRGTHDLMPEDFRHHRFVADTARDVVGKYGYEDIMTPIFEFTDVFQRTLGDTSDVVSKETYTFEDRGGESITLRPEFTAGIARAFITHGLKDQVPLKYFYHGPAFRYERPQKGRQRQFHQIGTELLGVAEPTGDVEMIAMAHHMLTAMGLGDKVKLELNTLGDAESRNAYRAALVEFFNGHRAALSEDSLKRLEANPLRILDSKDEGDRRIIETAPSNSDYFTTEARDFFTTVKEGLASLGIPFYLNPRLVRGLDYYCHTVFEFTTEALGAQNTVLAGGRYDALIAMMGGPDTPGCGWAAGVERLAALVEPPADTRRPVALIPMGEEAEQAAWPLAQRLRHAGVNVELAHKGNAGKRLKKANKLNACAALMLGEDELTARTVTLRDLDSGEQQAVKQDVLVEALAKYRF